MASIYDSQIIDSRNIEKNRMNDHLKSTNTIQPKSFQKDFGTSIEASFNKDTNNFISTLSGERITKEDFTHSNMTPFFGSKVRQNTDIDRTEGIVSRHTGVSDLDKPKDEISPMFQSYKENVHGDRYDYENRARYIPSNYQQGVPIQEPVNVGPGLNKGFTAAPSGGFQQSDSREYALKRGVDDLRVKTNPKIVYEGRHTDGFKGSRRGLQADVKQNCAVRVHDWSKVRLNPVTDNKQYTVRIQHCSDTLKVGPKRTNYIGTMVDPVKGLTVGIVDKLKETLKHASLFEFIGFVGDKDKQVTYYDPNDTARTTIRETTQKESNGYDGNIGNKEKTSTYSHDSTDFAKTTERETQHTYYSGTGESIHDRPTDYTQIYNAELNELREGISKGREPTTTSVKVGGIASQIGEVELSNGMENTYLAPMESKVDTKLDSCDINMTDNKKDNDPDDRLDPELIEVLRENPYERILADLAAKEDRRKNVEIRIRETNVRENDSCEC
jgi:hypothetical protein|tara:strand:+ start:1489 stop:2985 length:1497 start_codon:yes stop_codon:yes gene_type:complete